MASIPAGNYMFKVNNRNTRTRCEIYFTPCPSVSIVSFEQVNVGWDRFTNINTAYAYYYLVCSH